MAQRIRGFWFRLCGFFVGVFGTLFGANNNAKAAGVYLGSTYMSAGSGSVYTECQQYSCTLDEIPGGDGGLNYFDPQVFYDFIMRYGLDDCVEKYTAIHGSAAQYYCDTVVDWSSVADIFNEVYDIYWTGDGYVADGVYNANGNCDPCYSTTTNRVLILDQEVPYFAALEYMKRIDPHRINEFFYMPGPELSHVNSGSSGNLNYEEEVYYVGEKMWLGFENAGGIYNPFVTSYGSVFYSMFRVIGCSNGGRLSGATAGELLPSLSGVQCITETCPNVDDYGLLNLQYSMRGQCYINMDDIEDHNLYDATGNFFYIQPSTESGNVCYCFENGDVVCS